nr:M48 family metallopeptidase [Gammaproteobacteria bacterium]
MLRARACVLVITGVLVFDGCHGQSSLAYAPSESERSQLAAARIESEWAFLEPGRVVNYVRAVGRRLAQAAANLSGPPDYPWRFKVVRDRAVTAFAIGGGRIYVSDGALASCDNDAEFAALLAHEMGHQIEGHFRDIPALPRRSDGRSHLPMGSLSLAVNPAHELAADAISIELLSAAGYAPHAALRVAHRALEQSEAQDPHRWNERRIAALERLLVAVSPRRSLPSPAFSAAKRSLAPR